MAEPCGNVYSIVAALSF